MSLSVKEIRAVPPILSGTVVPAHLDFNGHMNVVHYFELATSAMRMTFRELAVAGPAYVARWGCTTFSVEHNLRYISELRLGEKFAAHVLLVDRTDKALLVNVFLLNETRDVLSLAFESVIVHVSVVTRRAVDFPAEVARKLERVMVAQPVPRRQGGALALRRPEPRSNG